MMQVIREYFVDQEKYFYFILLHLDAAMCIGTILLLTVGMQATPNIFVEYLKSPDKHIYIYIYIKYEFANYILHFK